MIEKFLARLGINAVALWAAAYWIDGISFSTDPWEIAFTSLVFAGVNSVIRPVLQLFALPFIFLTLGIMSLVINAGMLLLTANLTKFLVIDTFGDAFWGAIVVGLVSWVVGSLLAPVKAVRA